jgi:hypothetical protein
MIGTGPLKSCAKICGELKGAEAGQDTEEDRNDFSAKLVLRASHLQETSFVQ